MKALLTYLVAIGAVITGAFAGTRIALLNFDALCAITRIPS
jgi:hypothetical protein